MPRKTALSPRIRSRSLTRRVTDKTMVEMYQSVLPLVYHNPTGIELLPEIKKLVRSFLPFDYYHYVVRFDSPEQDDSRLLISLEKFDPIGFQKPKFTLEGSFKEDIDGDYQDCIKEFHDQYGDDQKFDYYRISSKEDPKIAIGLFRCVDSAGHNRFTTQEKRTLERLAPHIFLLYRTAVFQLYRSENIQYFGVFSRLASKLANDHDLSETEVKLLPDLIFGFTNEQIAERHFVSLATVKTHINHILKKTGAKNRLDFLGKFFTSPEHVQL